MTAPDRVAALAESLHFQHVRSLRHISTMLLFGWDEYRDIEQYLEHLELIHGEWMGTLDAPARPMWTVTALGREVLTHIDAQARANPAPEVKP